jgi:hypothetical protein
MHLPFLASGRSLSVLELISGPPSSKTQRTTATALQGAKSQPDIQQSACHHSSLFHEPQSGTLRYWRWSLLMSQLFKNTVQGEQTHGNADNQGSNPQVILKVFLKASD